MEEKSSGKCESENESGRSKERRAGDSEEGRRKEKRGLRKSKKAEGRVKCGERMIKKRKEEEMREGVVKRRAREKKR